MYFTNAETQFGKFYKKYNPTKSTIFNQPYFPQILNEFNQVNYGCYSVILLKQKQQQNSKSKIKKNITSSFFFVTFC